MPKKNKQPKVKYELLPDYMLEATPEVQEQYEKADKAGKPRPLFYFVRLLDDKYKNWVINLVEIDNVMISDAQAKIGFTLFRVPNEVTDEYLKENIGEIKKYMATVIDQILLDAVEAAKKKLKIKQH